MTDLLHAAGRRPLVAAPVVALVLVGLAGLTGCSAPASSSPASTPASPLASSPASPSVDAADQAAQAARAKALTAMKTVTSYAFSSTEVLGSDTTLVTGRVVLPTSLDYVVSKGSSQQEVIRVAGATYVRAMPGAWKKLAKPGKDPSPLAGLLAALKAVDNLTVDAAGTHLTGSMTVPQAVAAGLISNASSGTAIIPVTFVLDSAGRVIEFGLSATLTVGGKHVTLTEDTTYSAFGKVPAVKAP